MSKTFCIIAGEKSGDLLGYKILKSFKETNPEINFIGVGGELMEQIGFKSIFPISDLSVMGIVEVIPKIFTLIKRINETVDFIIKNKPDVVLTIDSPDFCFRVMKKVKKLDKNNEIKKIHFVAPSVWAYRKNRAKKIAKIYDLLFCILPFEPPYFEKYGLKTVFVGHPMFDDVVAEENNYDINNKIISITAGSRKNEIKILLPIICDSIINLNKKNYNFYYNFLATSETVDFINDFVQDRKIDNLKIVSDVKEKDEIMKKSKLVIAKSGTNNLEIAKAGVPMIVIYKFSFITNIMARILRKKSDRKFANLINIINNNEIIPELVLEKCNSKNIINMFELIINDEIYLQNQIKNNQETIRKLGYKGNNSSVEIIKNNILELLK